MENLGMEYFYPGEYAKERDSFASVMEMNISLHKKRRECMGKTTFDGQRMRQKWFDSQRSPGSHIDNISRDERHAFDFASPEYTDEIITQFKPLTIHKGNKVNVISLLGDEDTHLTGQLRGKYVLLCCFYVPIFSKGSFAGILFNLSLLSKELSSIRRDFEMILVVKMRPNWAHDKDVFDHFVSAFSESCIVLPFEDTTRIDRICRCLNLHKGPVVGFLAGPDGVVIQDSVHNIQGRAGRYIFPFTDDRIRYYSRQCWRNQTLGQLLEGSYSFVYRNRPGIGPVSIPVSELEKEEVVGVYLCGIGHDIPLLDRVYRECQAKQLGFEIVLVYTPFITLHSPEVLEEVIGSFLDKRNISWWVLPFSYFVSKRLFNLVRGLFSDMLLILSRGKLVDIDGLRVVRALGCEGYPFDRESIIQKALEKIKAHTLESLLAGGSLYRGNNPNDEVHVTRLQRMNVVLYLGSAEKGVRSCGVIKKEYDQIKQKRDRFEVVFVNLDTTTSIAGEGRMSSMPWLVYHPDPSLPQSVVEAFALWDPHRPSNYIAFGEDGQICSLNAFPLVKDDGSEGFPFDSDLHRQLSSRLDVCLQVS